MYPWPTGDFDNAMDVALDAAMNYLERTGQAGKFTDVAIKAVEPKAEPYLNPKLYQRRS